MDKVLIAAKNYWNAECDDIRKQIEEIAREAYIAQFHSRDLASTT